MSEWWEGIDVADPIVKAWIKGGGGSNPGGINPPGGIGPLGGGPVVSPLNANGNGNANYGDPRKRRRLDFLSPGISNFSMEGDYGVGDQYTTAADRVNTAAGKFNFNPNMQDPELIALLGRLRSSQKERGIRSRDEYARAGLLGSSAMVSGQENLNTQFGGEAEDLTGQILGGQRGEQLGLYREDLGFRRGNESSRLGYLGDLSKMRYGSELERRRAEQEYMNQLLGSLGGFAGDVGYGWLANRFKWI